MYLYVYPYIYTPVQYLKYNMKTRTKYKKIAMLWLNSGYIFMVSCWEGNTISGVLGTYLLLSSLRDLYQTSNDSTDLEVQQSQDTSANFSVEVMVLWGAGCCHPKHRSQRVGKNYLAFHSAQGVLFPSARWLYLGKSLSWNALFYWIDFKKYYTITHTSFSVWLRSVVFLTMKCGVIYSTAQKGFVWHLW